MDIIMLSTQAKGIPLVLYLKTWWVHNTWTLKYFMKNFIKQVYKLNCCRIPQPTNTDKRELAAHLAETFPALREDPDENGVTYVSLWKFLFLWDLVLQMAEQWSWNYQMSWSFYLSERQISMRRSFWLLISKLKFDFFK